MSPKKPILVALLATTLTFGCTQPADPPDPAACRYLEPGRHDRVTVVVAAGGSPTLNATVEQLVAAEEPLIIATYANQPGILEIAASTGHIGSGPNRRFQDADVTVQHDCVRNAVHHPASAAGHATFSAIRPAVALADDLAAEHATVLILDGGYAAEAGFELATADLEVAADSLADQLFDTGLISMPDTHIDITLRFVDVGINAAGNSLISAQQRNLYTELCGRVTLTCTVEGA